MNKQIAVIGAGSWGIALALHAARAGAHVHLWARDPATRLANGAMPRLAAHPLPPTITVSNAMPEQADAVILAVPVQHLASVLPHVPDIAPFILCCKGVERATLNFPLEILARFHPASRGSVLSGPNFAHEIADGMPAAAALAAEDPALAARLAALLTTPSFRIYASDDPIGVQIGGAAKNVIAIAAGATIGAGMGENARAALITRGLAEIGRLANALGGKATTLSGLAGIGDLILTCTGPASRNYRVGFALGEGEALDDVLAALPGVAEGVASAEALLGLARRNGVSVPVIEAVADLLSGGIGLAQARDRLLARPVGVE